MRLVKATYVLLGVALLIVVAWEIDFQVVADELVGFGLIGLGVVLALYASSFVVDSLTWTMTMSGVPLNARWIGRACLVRVAGEAFNNVLPAASMGGEPLKAMLLHERFGLSYRDAAASLVLTRTINMVSLCLFLALGFALMMMATDLPPDLTTIAAIGLVVSVVATLALFGAQKLRLLSRAAVWFSRFRCAQRFASALHHLQAFDERVMHFYHSRRARFVWAVVLALVAWVLGVAEIYWAMQFLSVPVSWADAWIIEAVAQMVRTGTFFIPLSLGAQEGAFVVIVGALTGSPPLGLTLAIVKRARELIWIALGMTVAALLGVSPARAAGKE